MTRDPHPTIDQLLALKAKIVAILENQPRRKRQLARQLADIERQIDELQGPALMF
ncbi:MAG TPA: hypothetical protein PLA50_03415 [Bacteroidia bacterium]|nr:hypothetical protein [Bacteroidia bacterium]